VIGGGSHGYRRKPVPREWRENNHWLNQHTRYYGGGAIRGSRTYRSGGVCSCGARFGHAADKHNMTAADVRDAWLDHVAQAFHGDDYFVRG
jgi:hypothetical protein